jgi:hypothetical protein
MNESLRSIVREPLRFARRSRDPAIQRLRKFGNNPWLAALDPFVETCVQPAARFFQNRGCHRNARVPQSFNPLSFMFRIHIN